MDKDHSLIDEIKSRLPVEQLIGEYVTLKSAGGKYLKGLCPFHGEKTPSFTVTPDKGIFYCFGCQKKGSIFDFIMELEHLTFQESLVFLAKKAGLDPKLYEKNSGPENSKRQAVLELLERITSSFHYLLKNAPEAENARKYLAKRGISEGSIDNFNLGWAPTDRTWLYRFLKEKQFSDELLPETGLFLPTRPRLSFFQSRILFPIMNSSGQVLAFGGRILDEGTGPKYINSQETPFFKKRENLYGLSHALPGIRAEKTCYLAEGYLDILAMHQAGVTNTVAPLGTAFTEHQAKILHRWADAAIILFDSDNAGRKATERAVETCEMEGLSCTVAFVEGGKDPAEVLLTEGPEALQNMVKYSINSFTFLLEEAIKKNTKITTNTANSGGKADSDFTPEGKVRIVKTLVPYINKLSSAVKREECLKILSERMDIDFRALYRDLSTFSAPGQRIIQKEKGQKNPKISSELYVLIAVTMNFQYFTHVRNSLEVEDLKDEIARELFITLEECYRTNDPESRETVSFESLLEKVEDEVLKSVIIEKACSDEFRINPEQLIKDGIVSIKKQSVKRKRGNLILSLRQAEKMGNLPSVEELQSELKLLDDEYRNMRVMW